MSCFVLRLVSQFKRKFEPKIKQKLKFCFLLLDDKMTENIRKKAFWTTFTLSPLSVVVSLWCSSRHLHRNRSLEDSSAPSSMTVAVAVGPSAATISRPSTALGPLCGAFDCTPASLSVVEAVAASALSNRDPWPASSCWSRTIATDVCDSRLTSPCTSEASPTACFDLRDRHLWFVRRR